MPEKANETGGALSEKTAKQEIVKKTGKKPPAKKASDKKWPGKLSDTSWTIIYAALVVVMIAAIVLIWNDSVKVGASALADMYNTAYSEEKDASYAKLYQSAFDRAEKKYHVSNTVIISVGNLEESERLEVLKATDVEFITEDSDKNSGGVTAWLEVTGQGTFVVDLKAAEFIINNEQRNVLVRLPNPELTNITITKSERKLFKDDLFNGSYSEGVSLAIKQRNEAALQIQKALMSNQFVYENAQKVAKSMITNLIKQFNPDIPDLTVDVEYMD